MKVGLFTVQGSKVQGLPFLNLATGIAGLRYRVEGGRFELQIINPIPSTFYPIPDVAGDQVPGTRDK